MFTSEENGIINELSHSSSVTGSNRFMRFQTCDKRWAGALLGVKCCCSVWKPLWKSQTSPFEEEKERKKNIWPSGYLLVRYFVTSLGWLLIIKDEWYVAIRFTALEIFW